MDVFHLTCLHINLFLKVLKKMEFKAGINLYKTSKFVKNTIDYFQPKWRIKELQILYGKTRFHVTWSNIEKPMLVKPGYTFDFVIPGVMTLIDYDESLLPDLTKMSGMELLSISKFEQECLGRSIAAARPKALRFAACEYDEHNVHFESVQELRILLDDDDKETWTIPERLWAMGMTRRRLRLTTFKIEKELLQPILTAWLNGDGVGTLEELCIFAYQGKRQLHRDRNKVLKDKSIRSAAKEIRTINPNEAVIIRRHDEKSLLFKIEDKTISFCFQ